jgi:ABC transport system ATP-binding/permease protein
MPLVTLDRVSIAYGHLPLLDSAGLQIETGERLCVIGRNGTGKSTLLRIVGGET